MAGGMELSISRILKLISGLCELCLAIPIIGGLFVIGTGYTALWFMFMLHLITLVLSLYNQEPSYGPVAGMITSLIAWIPFVGWILHVVTGILLLLNAAQGPKYGARKPPRYS